jgi:tetratricopeptide (TPR) repeat protein
MTPTAARAQALTFCGQFDHLFGADANGRERLAQAVEIADLVGDGALQCLTKRTLALFSTDPLQARCLLKQAVEDGRAASNQREVSFALSFLATACEWQGDMVGAYAHSNQAVAAARASGDALAQAQALLTLAELLVARGEFVVAQTALDEALTLSKALDHHYYLATIYGQLAWLALARGDPAFARAHGRMSLEAARASGAGSASVETLLWAATVAIANGQVSTGVRWIAAAMGWQIREQTRADHTMWSRRWKLLGDNGALAAALDSARASLGEREFDSIWAIGERLTLDEVLDEALAGRG